MAILEGFPTVGNGALLNLARALGTPVNSGAMVPAHPLEDEFVYRVEPRNDGHGVEDDSGLLIFSTTDRVFDCHTDGYHNRDPIDLVLMLCVRADASGGVTTLAHVDDLLDALNAAERTLLADPVFPTLNGRTSVLKEARSGATMRLNLAEIERFIRDDDPVFTLAHFVAARRLDALARGDCRCASFALGPGDCLILDNRRVLHGRSALSAGSTRLLKRVWVRLKIRDKFSGV
jgi:alpha-ketoglutarate-dependent taurine dioxygenase